MVKQYPYKLQKLKQSGPTLNGQGAFVDGGVEWEDVCNCRDENSNGRPITFDGKSHNYSFLVQCPKGTEAIVSGSKIRVINQQGNVRLEGQVIHSSKDQLHTRIWV